VCNFGMHNAQGPCRVIYYTKRIIQTHNHADVMPSCLLHCYTAAIGKGSNCLLLHLMAAANAPARQPRKCFAATTRRTRHKANSCVTGAHEPARGSCSYNKAPAKHDTSTLSLSMHPQTNSLIMQHATLPRGYSCTGKDSQCSWHRVLCICETSVLGEQGFQVSEEQRCAQLPPAAPAAHTL
jgi:hypothetical protein